MEEKTQKVLRFKLDQTVYDGYGHQCLEVTLADEDQVREALKRFEDSPIQESCVDILNMIPSFQEAKEMHELKGLFNPTQTGFYVKRQGRSGGGNTTYIQAYVDSHMIEFTEHVQ